MCVKHTSQSQVSPSNPRDYKVALALMSLYHVQTLLINACYCVADDDVVKIIGTGKLADPSSIATNQ